MKTFSRNLRSVLFTGLCFGAVEAQVTLPRPDSLGWIKLFRGTNTSDFYVFTQGGTVAPSAYRLPFPSGPFQIQAGDTIRTTGSPNGQLIFRQNFSHYRMQVQFRWPGALGNTGVMTKIQENDSTQGGALPRAVECQGDPNQGMGQIWALGSIGGVNGGTWITVHARMVTHPQNASAQTAQADSTAPEISYGGLGPNTGNLIIGFPGWQQPRPAALNNGGWVTFEVESHGRDTTRHFIDGQKVMQYRDPRIAPRTNANQVIKYLTEGMLSLQSEGTVVWYRNFRIMLLPQDPLYPGLYTTWVLNRTITTKPNSRSRLSFDGKTLTVLSGKGFGLTGKTIPEFRTRKPTPL